MNGKSYYYTMDKIADLVFMGHITVEEGRRRAATLRQEWKDQQEKLAQIILDSPWRTGV
jgi:hypothetical protein